MAGPGTIESWSRQGANLARRAAFLPPLLTRTILGLAFFQAGLGKFRNLAGTADYFSSLGIPAPAANAVLVAGVELAGGLLLLAGLLTRLASLGLISTMVVALMTAERSRFLTSLNPAADLAPTDITAFTFLLLLLWLVAFGPGSVSADAFLDHRNRDS